MYRRVKNNKVCQSCRKSKTRCEVLDANVLPLTCHRCKVLVIDCSYRYSEAHKSAFHSPQSPPSVLGKRRKPEAENGSGRLLWYFISPRGHDLDWSAPLQAIQRLVTLKSTQGFDLELAFSGFSLSTVQPDSRIDRLTDLFHEKHGPWLDFQPIRNSANPLVDIACAAIASRHLSGSEGEQVRLRLQGLARDSVAQMIFGKQNGNDNDSLEGVQCLVMLALWGPFSPGVAMNSEPWPWDARELISAAVKMAGRMKLDRASEELEDLWKRALVDDGAALRLSEAAERMRLWVALTNVESMLSMGAPPPPSRRTATDHLWIRFPDPFVNNVDLCNLRLGLMAEQFDLCEAGTALPLTPDTDLKSWTSSVNAVLDNMKRGVRLLTPLPYVLPTRHQPYFHALHITGHTARILVLYHALWQARRSLPESSWRSHFNARTSPTKFLGTWHRDLILTSEALLIALLGLPAIVLATAPDVLYDMCALAAGYLVGLKLLAFHSSREGVGGGPLRGASDLLLSKTARRLADAGASCGAGHRAMKCSALIQEMRGKWDETRSGNHPRPGPPSSDSTDALGGSGGKPTQRPGVPVDRSGGLVFHMQCEEPPIRPRIVVEPEPEPVMTSEMDLGGYEWDMMFWDSIIVDETAFWNSLAIDGSEQYGGPGW